MKNIKKFACLFLVVIMFVSIFAVPAFAKTENSDGITLYEQNDGTYQMKSNNQKGIRTEKTTKAKIVSEPIYKSQEGIFLARVNNSKLIPVKRTSINLHNAAEVKETIQQYKLHSEAAEDLFRYSEQVKATSDSSSEIAYIYTPMSSSWTTTYTGYGNKQYYEEIIQYESHSNWATVNSNTWGDYRNSVIYATASEIFSGAISKTSSLAGGAYTVLSLFTGGIPAGIPTTSKVSHSAAKQENKSKIWTYVIESDGYHFGCLTESSNVYFNNSLVYNGGTYTGNDSPKSYYRSDDWNSADQRAYYAYSMGGVTERIGTYWYGGAYFIAI